MTDEITISDIEKFAWEASSFSWDQSQVDALKVLVETRVAQQVSLWQDGTTGSLASYVETLTALARQLLDTGGRMRLSADGQLDAKSHPLATRSDVEALGLKVVALASVVEDLWGTDSNLSQEIRHLRDDVQASLLPVSSRTASHRRGMRRNAGCARPAATGGTLAAKLLRDHIGCRKIFGRWSLPRLGVPGHAPRRITAGGSANRGLEGGPRRDHRFRPGYTTRAEKTICDTLSSSASASAAAALTREAPTTGRASSPHFGKSPDRSWSSHFSSSMRCNWNPSFACSEHFQVGPTSPLLAAMARSSISLTRHLSDSSCSFCRYLLPSSRAARSSALPFLASRRVTSMSTIVMMPRAIRMSSFTLGRWLSYCVWRSYTTRAENVMWGASPAVILYSPASMCTTCRSSFQPMPLVASNRALT